jgi:carbon monoxide dehydrogenase subunit G
MRVTFPISVSPEVWAVLLDPAVLVSALPGCRSVIPGPDGLRLVVDVSVASVRGLWAGTVTPAGEGASRVVGSGEPGRIDVVLSADPDRSNLTIEGTIDGPLSTVGSALLAAAIRRLTTETLAGAGR